MRSRYTAYSICDAKYIIKTTHPLNKDFMEDKDIWKEDINNFSSEFKFQKLTILEFIEKTDISYVTFTAKLEHNNTDQSFTEKSKFTKINNNWFYLSGEHI